VKRIAVWVEGDRDRRFFEAIVKPRLSPSYNNVQVISYRQDHRVVINRLLRGQKLQGYDRVFVTDRNSAPCVASRKSKLKERYPTLADHEIIVVSAEIESWYLAGLAADGASSLRVKRPHYTDGLTK
jgi:hypothetical protein